MAFKRNSFKSLINTKKQFFASTYKFKDKANFKVGSDVYVIPLGLESGYYETPCHRLQTHKVDGKTIGFNGSSFATYIKCTGIDESGNIDSSALCCTLAHMEKDRIPEKEDSDKRILSFATSRIHLPVLILGNSLSDDSKISFPISKVSILKDLKSENGLKFSFLDMSAGTFKQTIVEKYGSELQDAGELDYELDKSSEEFMEEVRKRLSKTVIKIHGVAKQGFSAAMKEYSFFPFDNKAIAAQSGEGERDAIINYQNNPEIVKQVEEFMALFDSEVDGLVQSWNEKDLQEYYNSAKGVALNTPISSKEPTEEVEVLNSKEYDEFAPVGEIEEPISDEELDKIMSNPFDNDDAVTPANTSKKTSTVDETDEIEYQADEEEFFLNDDEEG